MHAAHTHTHSKPALEFQALVSLHRAIDILYYIRLDTVLLWVQLRTQEGKVKSVEPEYGTLIPYKRHSVCSAVLLSYYSNHNHLRNKVLTITVQIIPILAMPTYTTCKVIYHFW